MYTLNYKISHYDQAKQILKVDATLPSHSEDVLKLFKGKVKLLSFECDHPFTESSPYILIKGSNSPIHISYTVQVSTPGKHGFYGTVSEQLTIFAGEQVFLFPTPLMLSGNFTPSTTIKSVEVVYDFPAYTSCIVPFKHTETSSLCQSPRWCDVYELLKSAYTFGNLQALCMPSESNSLHIHLDAQLDLIDAPIVQNIESLFQYYVDLFNMPQHTLSLILLASMPEPILGGCGRHVICSSFNPYEVRDWQLLAHRMFHSFMDTALPLSDFHMPPNLWLTEGLATYYENVALNVLSDNLKGELGIHVDKEFNRLYTRYLYAKLKDSTHFAFPPMAEKYIRSVGKLEFLHYTYAPLIVKYIEDTFAIPPQQPHRMLRILLNLGSHEPFSMQKFFTLILGPQVDAFAQNFLFEDDLLPLWYLSDSSFFTPEELIDDLNYFEYLLYSWFVLEDPTYKMAELSLPHSESCLTLSEPNHLSFAHPSIEDQVKTYSASLYQALKNQCAKFPPQ